MAKEWKQDRDEAARVAWLKVAREINLDAVPEASLSTDGRSLIQWAFLAGFEAGAHYAAEVASGILAGRR